MELRCRSHLSFIAHVALVERREYTVRARQALLLQDFTKILLRYATQTPTHELISLSTQNMSLASKVQHNETAGLYHMGNHHA